MKRRRFVQCAGIGAGALALSAGRLAQTAPAQVGSGPIVIVSKDKTPCAEMVMKHLKEGADALDAVVAGVNLVEEDPEDITVGYGGLPNERGVVELDASVMHGPTGTGGAVASLRGIKYPSRVARLVMQQTDHVLLVGEGALEFARAQGFVEENLLTEKSRRIWLHWKQTLSDTDDWIPPPQQEWSKEVREYFKVQGTIHCSAMDAAGNLSGCTSTSGLAFKLPGRVGDSPLIGCGLYTDNDFGSCGSVGRGEAVILSAGSHSVVENLRRGMPPDQAALKVLEWIVDHTKLPRLRNAQGRPDFNVSFYVLDKKGRHAMASIYGGGSYTVHDGRQVRVLEGAWLYRRQDAVS
ncbi:MAG: N(4)-(beta-N-acetylglucosaminyl)-L-asparaginase [Candidatus Polarisedimenticolia bacterium]